MGQATSVRSVSRFDFYPIIKKALHAKRLAYSGSPGRTRTCNLLVNSQPLLPIELPGNVAKSKLQKPRQVKVRTALCCTALDATEARRQYASTTGSSSAACTARSNSGRP